MQRALVLATLFFLSRNAFGAQESVTAIPFLYIGISEQEAKEVASELAEAAARRTKGVFRRAIELEGIPDNCMDNERCLRELAKHLRVSSLLVVVATATGKKRNRLQLTVTRATRATGKIVARAEATVSRNLKRRAAHIEQLAANLFPQAVRLKPVAVLPPPGPTTSQKVGRQLPQYFWHITGSLVGAGVLASILIITLGGGDSEESGPPYDGDVLLGPAATPRVR